MALAGALCHTLLAATGFTNKNLRVLMTGLLDSTAYTPGQMTYDLRRLRLGGLIRRLPHTNRYVFTADGIRIAVFYTKIYNRLLVPLTAANQPQAPPELRTALAAITRHVDDYATRARLPRSAVIDAMPRACRQFLLSRWSASLPGGNRRGVIAPSRRDSPAPREWRSRRRVR